MGAGIAQVASDAGHKVVLFDAQPQALERARTGLVKIMDRLVEKGRKTRDEADQLIGRIQYSQSIEEVRGAGLVIEAIVEDLSVKQDVFRTIEELVSEDCVLASNTSSLSIASIAGACRIPRRVIGIHFFNPAPLMRLVEIIPAIQTDAQVSAAVRDLIDGWGKVTVIAKDTPGFIVNRVARPFYSESLRILEEGIADMSTIDSAMTQIGGFRMGPFTLMDYIGNDVNYAVTESVWRACYFEPRYKPSFTQKRLVEAGYLGRKTGRGYYSYDDTIDNVPGYDQARAQQVFDRVIAMLINEAAEALHWGIASRDDIDLAMTKGVNYPKGLLAWADEIGVRIVVERLDTLYDEYREERYRCSSLLRRMARSEQLFYMS